MRLSKFVCVSLAVVTRIKSVKEGQGTWHGGIGLSRSGEAYEDFAASMGHIRNISHPDVQEKIEDSLRRIVAAGRTAGTLTMNDNVRRFAEIGVRCFFTATGPWVAAGARAFKANALEGIG